MNLKTNIVVISGKQGSGKSTVADLVHTKLDAKGVRIARVKFADFIYEIHDMLLERMSNYEKVPKKDGRLLQLLGTEWGRQIYGDDVWCRITKQDVEYLLRFNDLIIIDDCRFPNELACFPKALKVRLKCAEKVRKARCSSWRSSTTHPSEVALDSKLKQFDRVYNTSKLTAKQVASDIVRILKA